jgi:N-hydroxyarylamine O-acetyltransferase
VVNGDSQLNLEAYLERIQYHGPLAPNAESLRDLQVAHLLTVPFENLSIHAHEAIVLNDEALFAKIVERKRGGFCYELNGLFAALLRELGFEVDMLSAEVADADGGFSRPFDHMALMVHLEQRWLVDVGFGDSFVEPLLLEELSEQVQRDHAYRIETDGSYYILSRRDIRGEGEWVPQYRFTLQTYNFGDYEERCRYHQTSPQSHFTQGRICSRATEDGRITLSDLRLITTSKSAGRLERNLTSDEYVTTLREGFGVVI